MGIDCQWFDVLNGAVEGFVPSDAVKGGGVVWVGFGGGDWVVDKTIE